MSLANISIVGNLARAPEQMYFASGKVKTTLVVAVNGPTRNNKEASVADFYKAVTWGKLAELAGNYLAKGNQVAVSGRLVFEHWTDKNGNARTTPLVEVSQLALPPKAKMAGAEANGTQSGINGNQYVNPIGGELEFQEMASDEMTGDCQDICGVDEITDWQLKKPSGQIVEAQNAAGSRL